MTTNYIEPVFISSPSIEGIEVYETISTFQSYSLKTENREYHEIKFDDIIAKQKTIILGEPGCGKSELINQIEQTSSKMGLVCKRFFLPDLIAQNAKSEQSGLLNQDYQNQIICFDALDEVDANLFFSAVDFLSSFSLKHSDTRIFISCRTYYIKNNLSLIHNYLYNFDYLLVGLFDEKRIDNFLSNSLKDSEIRKVLSQKLKTDQGIILKSIFKIPRYLTIICAVINENQLDAGTIIEWKRSDFFEKAIYHNLSLEIKEKKRNIIPNEVELSKRILEKIALVMEINRTNRITIDEFVTILDDITSNINLAFLSNFNLSTFIDRLMKKTGDVIEFHNTEFQEYLAAKELIRIKSIDQVLFDLIVDPDFLHIYNNWYDVLRFVVELSPERLLVLARLLNSKKKELADEQLLKLLKQADITAFDQKQKESLFEIYYLYFQSHELYIHDYTSAIVSLYTKQNWHYFDSVITERANVSYHFSIYNQFYIASQLMGMGIFDLSQITQWKETFLLSAKNQEEDFCQIAAIHAIADIKDEQLLLELNEHMKGCNNPKVVETYLSALGSVCPNNTISVQIFLEKFKAGYKSAIHGLMSITDVDQFILVYDAISNDDELLHKFFNSDHYIYGYQLVSNSLRDLWDCSPKIAEIHLRLLEKMVTSKKHEYTYFRRDFIVQLLLILKKKDPHYIFTCMDLFSDIWKLYSDIWILQAIISPNQLLSIKEYVDDKKQRLSGDSICIEILRDIKNEKIDNKDKEIIYEEGRRLYSNRYKQWESSTPSKVDNLGKISNDVLKKIKAIDISTEKGRYNCIYYFCDKRNNYLLSVIENELEIKNKLQEALIGLIDTIDLNTLIITKTGENAITISNRFSYYLNTYIPLAIELGLAGTLRDKYKQKILRFLPLGFRNLNSNQEELNSVFDLIGDISPEEEQDLLDFLLKRNDDYINWAPSNLLDAIEKFRLVSFKGVVELFVQSKNIGLSDSIKAIDLLVQEFMREGEQFFIDIFNGQSLDEIKVDSLEERANYHLIFHFNNATSVKWRFDYLKKKEHICEFDLYDFEGSRGVSRQEAEMNRPTFCNCLIQSKRSDYVSDFIDLVEYSLTINIERKYWKYAAYLQSMALDYFRVLDKKEYVLELKNKIKNHPNQISLEKFYSLLKEVELNILNTASVPNIQFAVEKYNRVKETQYAIVQNETELFYLIKKALDGLNNAIINEGFYRPINNIGQEHTLKEDLIQKTLSVVLENNLYKLGLRQMDIIREVNLYDDKRPDILVKYGFIGPVVIEIKLLHNPEIKQPTKRHEYKQKLVQYMDGNNAQYAFYLIFQVHQMNGNKESMAFEKLKAEYQDISNLYPILFDCRDQKLINENAKPIITTANKQSEKTMPKKQTRITKK